MLSEMDKHFSKEVKYTRPEGGLFIWATFPEGTDMPEFCRKAVADYKVAVVPGDAFGECGEGHIRVSYAYSLKHLRDAVACIKEFVNEINNNK